jgi:hypothetical protein
MSACDPQGGRQRDRATARRVPVRWDRASNAHSLGPMVRIPSPAAMGTKDRNSLGVAPGGEGDRMQKASAS